MKTLVLSPYPLSSGHIAALRTECRVVTGSSEFSQLTLAELRNTNRGGFYGFLKNYFRSSVFLSFEVAEGRALLPVLELIGAALCPVRLCVFDHERRLHPISFFQIVRSAFSILWGSLAGLWSCRVVARSVDRLRMSSRSDVSLPLEKTGRVVYLKTNLWVGVKVGGSIGHIAGVCSGLIENGYDVDLYSTESGGYLRPEINSIAMPLFSSFGLPSEINLFRFERSFSRYVAENVVKKNDFVYHRLSLANCSGVAWAQYLGVPLVTEYNGSEAWIAKNWGTPLKNQRLAERMEEVCLRHSHVVVTISEVLRDELIARGVEERRIVSYPNCIDPGVFDPGSVSKAEIVELRNKWRIPEEATVFLFLGTFGAWHGAEKFAQAIALLSMDNGLPENAHFCFVGDGAKKGEVIAALHAVPKDRITMTGLVAQHEAKYYLGMADVLVSPHVPNADGSRFFGSPTKLFEYMAMEKTIIASELEQIGEVLSGSPRIGAVESLPDEEISRAYPDAKAILTTPGSVDDLVKAIRFVSGKHQFCRNAAKRARQTVLERYTWDKHVEAILSRLKEVC